MGVLTSKHDSVVVVHVVRLHFNFSLHLLPPYFNTFHFTFHLSISILQFHPPQKVDLVAGLKAGQDAASAATTKKVDDDVVKEGDGVFGVTSISNDNSARRKTRSGQPTVIGRAAAQLYRQHPAFEPTTTTTTTSSSVAGGGAGANNGSKRGTQKTQQSSNSFEPSLHRRVPVFGDTNNRFAPGARRRRDEDARVTALCLLVFLPCH